MSNTNRDYIVICDVKNSSLTVYRPIKFYVTDKNTSNIFIRLVTKIENDSGITEYVDIEPANNYVVTMRIIKPDDEVKSIAASKLEEGSIYQVDLQDDCKDIPGTYKCELLISTIVYGRQELNTSDMFTYNVVNSILSKAVITETKGITTEYILNQVDAYSSQVSGISLQLNDINSQIKENDSYMHKLRRKNVTYEIAKYPVITFIDDDGFSYFLEAIKPIFDKYGIKGSLGIVTDNINKPNMLTEKQLHDLQDEGYSILSHTKSHSANVFKSGAVNLSTVSDDAILEEYETAYNWLNSRGFKGADTLVYPWGFFGNETLRYKNLARRYYNNAVNAGGGVNTTNIKDNMYLNRYFIQKNKDISVYTNLIDECVRTKGWLIFGTHSNTNEIDVAHLESVVSYAVRSGASILPFIEANEVKGNAIQIGEFENDNSFYVSKDGDVKASNFVNCKVYSYEQTKDYIMDILPSNFKKGIHSMCIRSSNDTLTQQGGNLILHNNGGDFVYETFVPFGKTDMYIRKFDFRSEPQKWGSWKLINSEPKEYSATSLNPNYTTSTVRIKQDLNSVIGTIRLVNESKTGTFPHTTEMVKINNLQLPYYSIISCIITTANGEVVHGALEAYQSNGNVIFKCFGTVNKNNIRWIDINFAFNIHR